MADYRNALDPIDMGGYSPEQAWRGRYRVPQGGVLDTLPDDAPMPSDPVQRNALAAYFNQGLGLVNHYAMGIPATMAGLVNAAIPGQPFGDMWSAVQSGKDAADEFAANGRGARDLLSLPDAFAGSVPGGVGHVASRETPWPKPGSAQYDSAMARELMERPQSAPTVMDGLTPSDGIRPARDPSGRRGEIRYGDLRDTSPEDLNAQSIINMVWKRSNDTGSVPQHTPSGGLYFEDVPLTSTDQKYLNASLNQRPSHSPPMSRDEANWQSTFSPVGPPRPAVVDNTNASAYLDLFKEGAAQAGRGIDNALTSAVRAMPDNAVGSAGGKLSAPSPAGMAQVWGPKWDIAMGQQYRIAEAGGDLSTMYDILTAKLSKASGIEPEMRAAMEAKVREIHNDMGQEWRRLAGIEDEPQPGMLNALAPR